MKKWCNEEETYITLIQALIVFWLDYGNVLFSNTHFSDKPTTASTELAKGNIKHQLSQLHTLHIRFISLSKMPFNTLKVLSGTAPLHIANIIENYIPVRMQRYNTFSFFDDVNSYTTILSILIYKYIFVLCDPKHVQITLHESNITTFSIKRE